jgi:hypothetical protein
MLFVHQGRAIRSATLLTALSRLFQRFIGHRITARVWRQCVTLLCDRYIKLPSMEVSNAVDRGFGHTRRTAERHYGRTQTHIAATNLWYSVKVCSEWHRLLGFAAPPATTHPRVR